VRDYLTNPGSKDVAYDRASAFLEALFKHTTSTLHALDSPLDYDGFAGEFRSRMTEGQRMKGHNQFLEDFYKRVVEKAKQLEAQRVCNIRVRSYALLRCSARHRTRLRGSEHLLSGQYSIIHLSPRLHEARISPLYCVSRTRSTSSPVGR
jgi:hypothetical protein